MNIATAPWPKSTTPALRYLSTRPEREHAVDGARAEAEEEEEDVGGHEVRGCGPPAVRRPGSGGYGAAGL